MDSKVDAPLGLASQKQHNSLETQSDRLNEKQTRRSRDDRDREPAPRDESEDAGIAKNRRDPDRTDGDKSQVAHQRDDKAAGETNDKPELAKPPFWKKHPYLIAGAVLIVLAAAIAGLLYWILVLRHYESTDDAFIASRPFSVASKVTGYVVKVDVTDNQHVSQGAPLVEIDKRDYQNAVEQAEAKLRAAEASIANVNAQITAQKTQVDEAKAATTQVQAAVQFAIQEETRAKDLVTKGAGTVQAAQQTASNLKQQQANLTKAKATESAAEQQIEALQAQRNSAVANQTQAQAQLDSARLNLDYATIKAAQSGTVTHLTAAKGQYAQVGQSLMMFVPDDFWITANFKETQLTDMRPGQVVEIEIDAYPSRDFHGHVASIQRGSGTAFSVLPAENATGNYVKVVQRIPVKIVLDNPPKDIVLGPGMSVVPSVRVR